MWLVLLSLLALTSGILAPYYSSSTSKWSCRNLVTSLRQVESNGGLAAFSHILSLSYLPARCHTH